LFREASRSEIQSLGMQIALNPVRIFKTTSLTGEYIVAQSMPTCLYSGADAFGPGWFEQRVLVPGSVTARLRGRMAAVERISL
jgi:hypothetical protein